MNLFVIIRFTVKPEMLSSFIELLEELRIKLNSFEGCEGISIYQGKKSSNVLNLVEAWQDEAAHKKYLVSLVAEGHWSNIHSHLLKDPSTHYCHEL